MHQNQQEQSILEAISVDSTSNANDGTQELTTVSEPSGASAEIDETEVNAFRKKKRKQTANVWEDVTVITDNGVKKAMCNHCKAKLAIFPSGTTTHLNRHVANCVARVLNKKGQQKLTVKKDQLEGAVKVENWKWDLAKVREAFAQMVLVHEMPFNFAEYEMFNHFMRVCTPNWDKISRATARKDCESVYEIEKKKIKKMLNDARRISVTTDLWKSDQNVEYMVVIAHFADVDMNLQKRTLSFVKVPSPHTGIAICDALKTVFSEWEIDKKVWTITVDNASYNDVCVSNLKTDLGFLKKLPLDGKFFHVRCCAHILNILVQYGLTEIDDVIHNIRESVKYVGKSPSRLHIFSEIANQLKLPQKKLILDCGTRWNATYMMLSNALLFKDVFPRFKQRDEGYKFLPSEEDWAKAFIVCSFLEEFNAVTNLISGIEYPTSNLFLPELVYIQNLFDNALDSPDDLLKGMVGKMKEKFVKYWGQSNLLLAIAAILDPRLKTTVLSFAYECCPILEQLKYENEVKDSLHALFDDYVQLFKERTNEVEVEVSKAKTIKLGSSRPPLGKGLGRGFSMISKSLRNDTFQSTKSELDLYLEDGVVLHNEDIDPPFDVLKWWRDNKNKYRVLSSLACDILAIPISTVASESAFSAGGRVIDPYRCSLKAETVQFLTCGADWVRGSFGIKKKERIAPSTNFETEIIEFELD